MRLFLIILALALPGPVFAVDLTCTVPAGAATTRGGELCEILRQQLKVRPADWSNDACATELLRQGLRNFEGSVTRLAALVTADSTLSSALSTFDTNHPESVTAAVCGDGVVDDTDPDLGEQCDPPNGTTCDAGCKTIIP